MNEHFRVAHKLGLMFRPDEALPRDIKSWAIKQLRVPSPVLGTETVHSEIKPWPKSLQPNLEDRAAMMRLHWENTKKRRQKIKGYDTEAARQANDRDNRMHKKDMLKFAHQNVYGSDQVRQRLVSFWTNHFTMGGFESRELSSHAMEEGILGSFNDSFASMLYKATTHPAMLMYLDNHISAGPNSNHVRWARSRNEQAGLNDNLGRELLELHTVSPDVNYTETDIRNAAKVLAGWGMDVQGNSPQNLIEQAGTINHWDMYKKNWAEPGSKVVLGKTIYQGKQGLKQLTDFLATHDHTINHLSFKLAEHFVRDDPQQADIDYISNAWRQGNGSMEKIHTAVIERAIDSKEPKFQWPMNWLFQVIRLTDARYFKGWSEVDTYLNRTMETRRIFEELGQSFWVTRQPNGYSSKKEDWMSGEMFERRIRFSESIYNSGARIIDPVVIMDRIGANKETRRLLTSLGMSRRNQFIALMCSPELMGLENA